MNLGGINRLIQPYFGMLQDCKDNKILVEGPVKLMPEKTQQPHHQHDPMILELTRLDPAEGEATRITIRPSDG